MTREDDSDLMSHRYSIYIQDECKFSDLTQHEYFDIMEDLAIEYYQTGLPSPQDLRTEIYQED